MPAQGKRSGRPLPRGVRIIGVVAGLATGLSVLIDKLELNLWLTSVLILITILTASGLTLAEFRFMAGADEETAHALVKQVRGPNLLPPPTVPFVGRTELVAEIQESIAQSEGVPVIVLHGKGGVGKTALAIHFAHQSADKYSDGQLYADLRGASADPAATLVYFLRSLGVEPEQMPFTLDERVSLFRTLLTGKRVIVVLDNARDSDQVEHLLPGERACLVLVTSRPPLTDLSARNIRVDVASEAESLELLRALAGRAVDADPEAAREIVRLCGNLPLAVRVNGGRIGASYRTLAWHCDQLRERRVEDVEASLSLSYAELEPRAQRAFRLLGLVASPMFGAWVLAPLLDCTLREAERLIDVLVHAQLADVTAAAGGPGHQYALHELIREFAVHRLKAEEVGVQRRAARDRLLRAYMGLAEHARRAVDRIPPHVTVAGEETAWDPVDEEAWVAEIDQNAVRWFAGEYGGLIDAVVQADQAGLSEVCWRIAGAMARCSTMIGAPEGWERTLDRGLAAAHGAGSAHGEALIRFGIGDLHRAAGRLETATTDFEEAASLFETAGDPYGRGATLRRLAQTLRVRGMCAAAADNARTAIDLAHRLDHPTMEARALRTLGHVYMSWNKGGEAVRFLEPALERFRAEGDRWAEGRTLLHLAGSMRAQGRFDEAIGYLDAARVVFGELGDPAELGHVLREFGHVQLRRGDLSDADRSLSDALLRYEEMHLRFSAARLRRHLARLRVAQGRVDEAEAEISLALEAFRGLNRRYWTALAQRALGEIRLAQGRLTDALTELDEALSILRQFEDGYNIAETSGMVARVHLAGHACADAIAHATRAVEFFATHEDQAAYADALDTLADAQRACGRRKDARGTAQQAIAVRRTLRGPRAA